MDGVAEEFEGGVEGFGGPDGADGGDEPAPFGAGEWEEGGGGEDGEGGEGVDAGVFLGAEEMREAGEGVAEAAEAAAEESCEWCGRAWWDGSLLGC